MLLYASDYDHSNHHTDVYVYAFLHLRHGHVNDCVYEYVHGYEPNRHVDVHEYEYAHVHEYAVIQCCPLP